jgi:hypothetical protein
VDIAADPSTTSNGVTGNAGTLSYALAQNITQHYRQAGYPLARAYLPAQEVLDGIIDIAILKRKAFGICHRITHCNIWGATA